MVSPYFEGAESSPGLGVPQFQGIMGVWGLKPEDMTQNGSKSCPEPSKFLKTGQNTLTRPRCRPNNFFFEGTYPPMTHTFLKSPFLGLSEYTIHTPP